MTYNNPTKSKYSYEVDVLNSQIDKSIGEFKTVKEARKAVKQASLPVGTLVTIRKLEYSEQTPCFSSGIVGSKMHTEFKI